MLLKLITEYIEQYPKEENPFNYLHQLGEDYLIEILQNRNGKKIKIEHIKGVYDDVNVVYI